MPCLGTSRQLEKKNLAVATRALPSRRMKQLPDLNFKHQKENSGIALLHLHLLLVKFSPRFPCRTTTSVPVRQGAMAAMYMGSEI